MTGQDAMFLVCLGLFSVVADIASKGFRRTGGQR